MIPPRVKVTWRVAGGKKPAGVVICGRGTAWGNDFKVGETYSGLLVRDKAHAVKLFERLARMRLEREPGWLDPLKGATGLACPGCDPADLVCHLTVIQSLMAEQLAPTSSESVVSGHGEKQGDEGVREGTAGEGDDPRVAG